MNAPRIVEPGEREALRRLVAGSGLPLVGLDDSWRTLVLTDESGIAATASLERYDDPEGPVFLLRSVAVRADRRGEGLGQTLTREVLAQADGQVDGAARTALLTETAAGYFDRFGFRAVQREQLPAALAGSAELTGACPDSASAYLRP